MRIVKLLKIPFRFMRPPLLFSFLLLISLSGQAEDSDLSEREILTQQIIDIWKGTSPVTRASRWEAGIKAWLEKLSSDDLLAALEVNNYEELAVLLRSKGQSISGANSLDVVSAGGKAYYPLSPCRLVDTRYATGIYTGPIDQGTSMNFHAKDALEIEEQGGKVGGCNVPPTAAALVINITSVNQSASGFLSAYPFGASLPNASILNFTNSAIANSTILPVCTGTCAADLSIFASRSTQVIVDVMGYFAD